MSEKPGPKKGSSERAAIEREFRAKVKAARAECDHAVQVAKALLRNKTLAYLTERNEALDRLQGGKP